LRRASGRDAFELEQQGAVQMKDLRRALLDHNPQIVHFSGHGETEGIMVQDSSGKAQLVDAQGLAGLFKLFRNQVECVLLNCCYSEPQAKALNEHIPYVIGMKNSITDEAAREFSVGFYDAAGAGRSYEEAFDFGCNAIQLFGIPEHATPVLLANPELLQKQSGTDQPKTTPKQKADNIPEEYQEAYELLQQKLKILTKARSVENDAARKFQLDHQIAEAKKDMQQLTEW
ncbi:MAG: CHAT domain-containing protein, partial [Candidatus Electrothrix sp. AR5]|nr:CHAT domain-containing protein [Candidatus Electrothrix sp. AR5]